MTPFPPTDGYRVQLADWSHDADRRRLIGIRRSVFILEQQVPQELEWDGLDPDCVHLLALGPKRDAVGTGRLEPSGRLGRIAVCRAHRRCGIGSLVVAALLHQAQHAGMRCVTLHSQTQVRRFYEQHGFQACSTPFIEAGIPHIAMRKSPPVP